MLKTLGLDDDLDPVEVVMAIEKAFEFAARETEAVFKVGQLFDLLRTEVRAGDANRKCASAMAFYRIRRAFDDLQVDIRSIAVIRPIAASSHLHKVICKVA